MARVETDLRARDRSQESRDAFRARVRAALAGIAAAHAGGEVLLITPASVLTACIAESLALPPARASRLRPRREALTAIDWPCTSTADTRPALIGVDLDWQPPRAPRVPVRFPGGPGSAPSAGS